MNEIVGRLHGSLEEAKGRYVAQQVASAAKVRAFVPVKVEIRKPRWMPGPAYRWLLRTIVVVEGTLQVELSDDTEGAG